jgi:hypothetical protein
MLLIQRIIRRPIKLFQYTTAQGAMQDSVHGWKHMAKRTHMKALHKAAEQAPVKETPAPCSGLNIQLMGGIPDLQISSLHATGT